jgi:hypothetical protein
MSSWKVNELSWRSEVPHEKILMTSLLYRHEGHEVMIRSYEKVVVTRCSSTSKKKRSDWEEEKKRKNERILTLDLPAFAFC